MSVKLSSPNHVVALFVLAVASGCGSATLDEPVTNTRRVTGSVTVASRAGLDVPSVVAQDGSGRTFDGPVQSDGRFSLTLPIGSEYRLFITDRHLSGLQSTESTVLWPGGRSWAVVGAGTTSDGAPIDVGTVRPVIDSGTTSDGAGNGTSTDGAGDGSNGGGAGSSGHGSTGGGRTGDGASSGSGKGGGPNLCVPPKVTQCECTGSGGDGAGSGGKTGDGAGGATGGGAGSGLEDSGCEADLPYDAKLPVGATYYLEQSFWEKGPSPVKILSVTVEGGHRQKELAANTPFIVTAEDCSHVGNKDVGRDRIFVTWQNANGSTETDHLDMRYCADGGGWNPGPPVKIPESCLSSVSTGSSAPSDAPSGAPSNAPSGAPSNAPSDAPSGAPSHIPPCDQTR